MDANCLNAKVSKGTISKIIIDRITNALLSGELKPGERLPTDTELAQMLGVGRNSVREALKIMEAFGILEIKRSEGIYICSRYSAGMLNPLLYGVVLSGSDMNDAFMFRCNYFQMLLFIDIKHVTEEDIESLKDILSDIRKNIYVEKHVCEVYKGILRFQEYLAELSGNQMAGHIDSVLEKFCRNMEMQRIKNLVEQHRGEVILELCEQCIVLLEKKDRMEILDFFDKIENMCDFNKN